MKPHTDPWYDEFNRMVDSFRKPGWIPQHLLSSLKLFAKQFELKNKSFWLKRYQSNDVYRCQIVIFWHNRRGPWKLPSGRPLHPASGTAAEIHLYKEYPEKGEQAKTFWRNRLRAVSVSDERYIDHALDAARLWNKKMYEQLDRGKGMYTPKDMSVMIMQAERKFIEFSLIKAMVGFSSMGAACYGADSITPIGAAIKRAVE